MLPGIACHACFNHWQTTRWLTLLAFSPVQCGVKVDVYACSSRAFRPCFNHTLIAPELQVHNARVQAPACR